MVPSVFDKFEEFGNQTLINIPPPLLLSSSAKLKGEKSTYVLANADAAKEDRLSYSSFSTTGASDGSAIKGSRCYTLRLDCELDVRIT